MNALSSVFVVCTLLVAGADDKAKAKDQIVGKWEATSGDIKGALIEFTKDGVVKVVFEQGGQKINLEGKYKFTDEKTIEVEIKVQDQTMKEKNKVEFKGKDQVILTDEKDMKVELKRVTK